MKPVGMKLAAANALVFVGVLLLIEVPAQVIARIHPSFDVLYLKPDKELGWTQVPNLRWTWTGHHWYAADFRVDIETNSRGFRDVEREVGKPVGVRRVALLGDSFIEAVQVPQEKTAAGILERRLNAPTGREGDVAWEVLNFGISNYGVGQYLLAWEQHAQEYKPDYVGIFVAEFHMERTVGRHEFSWRTGKKLWIRPTFRLEHGELIREPMQDYARFVEWQNELIRTEFDGRRSRPKRTVVTAFYANQLKDRLAALFARVTQGSRAEAGEDLLGLNLKIIEEIGRQVSNAGGRFVVLDASRYFGDSERVPAAVRELCAVQQFGYIPLYEALMRANAAGISTQWAYDGHLNEPGNEILAATLFDWIAEHPPDGDQ